MQEYINKANILIEALPYIQDIYGKTVVVKYGGNAMLNDELKNSVMEDITLLKYIGANPILVHGGGPDISNALKTYNVESTFIDGLRVTDETTVNVAQMVLCGKTNKEIVSMLNKNGGKALGLCGIDGKLIRCEQLDSRLGYVGKIVSVDSHLLDYVARDAYIPVIAPIGVDDEGHSYNINADTVAAAVAKAVHAEKLMFLTDIDGVHDAQGNLIYEMTKSAALGNIERGVIGGGMIPKVRACIDAIDDGVNRVHIIDGRIPHSILLEIFTDAGIGTMIKKQ